MKIKKEVINPKLCSRWPKKESGISLKSQVRGWLDGKERWVFVIEEGIKKMKRGKYS